MNEEDLYDLHFTLGLAIRNVWPNQVDSYLRAACGTYHPDDASTLKYFTITQSGNTMTLVANGSSLDQIALAPIMPPFPVRPNTLTVEQPIAKPEIKRRTAIKRTVSCDANHVCTTKYSDR